MIDGPIRIVRNCLEVVAKAKGTLLLDRREKRVEGLRTPRVTPL